jgi:hypothetical protein
MPDGASGKTRVPARGGRQALTQAPHPEKGPDRWNIKPALAGTKWHRSGYGRYDVASVRLLEKEVRRLVRDPDSWP